MKPTIKLTVLMLAIVATSCLSDKNKEQLNKMKNGVKSVNTVVKNAEKTKENIERLKNLTPLTSEQLKKWLPENLNEMKRTGFKVGTTGYMNIASITGTYKIQEPENKDDYTSEELKKMRKSFSVTIIDGAGPTGSMAISGVAMVVKAGIEEENEQEHLEPVVVNGLKASQSYNKKRNDTELMFVYDDRFAFTIKSTNMDADETWQVVKNLDLKDLTKMAD